MEELRRYGQFALNKGEGMAKGLYNVTNDILLETTDDKGVSYWFGEEMRDILLSCGEKEFARRCVQMAGNDINLAV